VSINVWSRSSPQTSWSPTILSEGSPISFTCHAIILTTTPHHCKAASLRRPCAHGQKHLLMQILPASTLPRQAQLRHCRKLACRPDSVSVIVEFAGGRSEVTHGMQGYVAVQLAEQGRQAGTRMISSRSGKRLTSSPQTLIYFRS